MIAQHMSLVKDEDTERVPWFENCLVGTIAMEQKHYAVGYDLSYVAEDLHMEVAKFVNQKIMEVIGKKK